MKVVDREYVESHKNEIIEAIRHGAIFIYPTDTIYGLGTNALLEDPVQKIREIKKRDTKPMSVMAPNKEWIEEHCVVSRENLDTYLPGPYTLFVERKKNELAQGVNPNDNTLGVRIPKHWFTDVVSQAGVPFITTSVNLAGEKHMETLEDLKEEILDQVDYVVYEGEKRGESSIKISLL
jgi:L-threonylcarbamoyladenylate synthase